MAYWWVTPEGKGKTKRSVDYIETEKHENGKRDWDVEYKNGKESVGESNNQRRQTVSEGSYMSRSVAGNPKLKAAFLSPRYIISLQLHLPFVPSLSPPPLQTN